MRCLIRQITRRSKSGVTHEDKHFEGETLSIGRSTDQDVFLSDIRVALQHAIITSTKSKKFQIQGQALSGIIVNNHPVKSARLSTGDIIHIANYEIRLLDPPDGYDLALEIEAQKGRGEAENPIAKRSRMTLAAAGLKRRPWSWILFSVLLVAFLILPVSGAFNESWRETLRVVPVVSDASWDTGGMSNPHKYIGDDCNACHQTPFILTQDASCVACHKDILQHADPEQHKLPELTETRCASCHREHNAPISLVRHDEGLCSDCHANLSERDPSTEIRNVSDFGDAEDHPEFRVTMLSFSEEQEQRTRVSLADNPQEKSNLVFDHKAHLKEGGIKPPKRTEPVEMECADCHILDSGGALFLPIDMESMCSECHTLTFDSNAPEREVPHGSAIAVINNIKEYYRTRALEGGYLDDSAPAIVRSRRRPGQDSMSQQDVEAAFRWSEQKWRNIATEMFEKTTCKMCHEITKISEDPPSWYVLPVRVTQVWMPKAYFGHAAHHTMECVDCHQATDSEVSSDVLMPRIESCRECHGGEHATDKLTSSCVDCHGYHIAEGHIMGKDAQFTKENGLKVLAKMLVGAGSGAAPREVSENVEQKTDQ